MGACLLAPGSCGQIYFIMKYELISKRNKEKWGHVCSGVYISENSGAEGNQNKLRMFRRKLERCIYYCQTDFIFDHFLSFSFLRKIW